MKKILFLTFILLIFSMPVLSADWYEVFEKQYLDKETIEYNAPTHIVKFWVKKLRKNPKEKIMDKNYWYSVDRWEIDLKNKKSRIVSINFYDLNENIIFGDDYVPNWNNIIPDTYAEGFYKLFYYLFEYKE